jgi:hypothetical protein
LSSPIRSPHCTTVESARPLRDYNYHPTSSTSFFSPQPTAALRSSPCFLSISRSLAPFRTAGVLDLLLSIGLKFFSPKSDPVNCESIILDFSISRLSGPHATILLQPQRRLSYAPCCRQTSDLHLLMLSSHNETLQSLCRHLL